MSVHHTITTGLAAGALLGASLLLSPTATAAPPNPSPLGVKGHDDLPRGGRETCPVTATRTAR